MVWHDHEGRRVRARGRQRGFVPESVAGVRPRGREMPASRVRGRGPASESRRAKYTLLPGLPEVAMCRLAIGTTETEHR
jgi:hypothetical protein